MVGWSRCCGLAAAFAGGIAVLGTFLGATAVSAQSSIAGVQPDRRPDSAPKVQSAAKPKDWQAKATAGVVRPLPPTLKFLDDQGGWYTPFDRPGMPGPYDIRKLHRN